MNIDLNTLCDNCGHTLADHKSDFEALTLKPFYLCWIKVKSSDSGYGMSISFCGCTDFQYDAMKHMVEQGLL